MSDSQPHSPLETFLTHLAAVAASGGDVRTAIVDMAVPKPHNITAVIDGADGAGRVIWARVDGGTAVEGEHG